jgi:hypothetical protein
MNPLAHNKAPKNHDPACGDLMTMAEQELAAFFSAVTALYGSEQAQLSAADWLRELSITNDLPGSTHEWRLLTVRVSAPLASRVLTSSASAAFQTLGQHFLADWGLEVPAGRPQNALARSRRSA